MVDIEFIEQGQVIILCPKAVLVLTRAQFIDALRRSKAYRRRQTLAAQLTEACDPVTRRTP